jgi:hypothetical protein
VNESAEVRLARLEERLSAFLSAAEADRQNTVALRVWMSDMDRLMTLVSQRLDRVDTSLTSVQPTLDEFSAIKHKVEGAGVAGKWMWAGMALIVGWISGAREFLLDLLSRGGQ